MFNSEIHIVLPLKCAVLFVMAQEAVSTTEMGTGMRNKHLLVAGIDIDVSLRLFCISAICILL